MSSVQVDNKLKGGEASTKPMPIRPGEALPPRIRHWRIDKKLGKGATATVYLGTSLIDSSLVAIKQFSNDLFQNNQHSAAYRKMMMNEAALVGKIVHPNILQTFSVGIESEQKYLVMEYVDSGALDDYVNTPESLGLMEILRVVFQCACGLEYADEIGIIHRDIKPANILLAQGKIPKVTDWGSSLKKGDEKSGISGVGSPAYMSPEQIRELPLNQQTDIYSMGVALFELIAGKKPFSAPSQYETVYKILHAEAPSLSQFIQSAFPKELDVILKKCLAKSQENRYLNWRDFIIDVSSLIVQLTPSNKLCATIDEVGAFDWLRACPSLNMFQDNELWDLIAVGQIVSMACALPITLRKQALAIPSNVKVDCMGEAIKPASDETITHHGFVLSGAVQFYTQDNRISILRTGDYAADIKEADSSKTADGFTLANVIMLNIPDEKIQFIHPVVRDKLNKLIEVSADVQRRTQSVRYSNELAKDALTEESQQ